MAKPYMPLMMGDWIRGTQGMRAEVKGVYIGLLIHQYDHGFLPDDLATLALIEPEVGKVWDMLKHKFKPAGAGRLQNLKLEEVRAFWSKQGKNGSLGGRPRKKTQTEPKQKPKINPNDNPNDNPNPNHQYDHDLDTDIDEIKKESEQRELVEHVSGILSDGLDEIYLEGLRVNWYQRVDFEQEVKDFQEKVRGSPGSYVGHDTDGIRKAFHAHLRNAKPLTKKYPSEQNKRTPANEIVTPKPGGFGSL